MKKNMGSADRLIRLMVVALFIILYFTNVVTGTLGIILMVAAAIFFLTSLVGFCPLYWPFGIHTNKNKQLERK